MKRTMPNLLLLCFLLLATAHTATADKPDTIISLWPEGLPNSNGIEQRGYDDSKRNFRPEIKVFLPAQANKPAKAVLICPGGAYWTLSQETEGARWAPFFKHQGVAVIVLKYRMPHTHTAVPVSDAMEAMRLIRENAGKWNIDIRQIGIMGSSAGGHLASTIATKAEAGLRPAFQILFYPVITMKDDFTHKGSRNNLLGGKPTTQAIDEYSSELHVTTATPRAFIVCCNDDKEVSPVNSIRYYEALLHHGIPATLHIYPTGGHGWGASEQFKDHALLELELASWLRSF